MPKLLRLFGAFADFPSLISLLRLLTGVSDEGNATLVVPVCCGSGDLNPFLSSSCTLAARLFFRLLSTTASDSAGGEW